MSIRRVVPNLSAADLDAMRRFYVDVLGFDVAMDMGWILTFVSPDNPVAQVSVSQEAAGSAAFITVEVSDVGAVHALAIATGCTIERDLVLEPWGVRRFFVRDPGGNLVNVMTHVDSEPERGT